MFVQFDLALKTLPIAKFPQLTVKFSLIPSTINVPDPLVVMKVPLLDSNVPLNTKTAATLNILTVPLLLPTLTSLDVAVLFQKNAQVILVTLVLVTLQPINANWNSLANQAILVSLLNVVLKVVNLFQNVKLVLVVAILTLVTLLLENVVLPLLLVVSPMILASSPLVLMMNVKSHHSVPLEMSVPQFHALSTHPISLPASPLPLTVVLHHLDVVKLVVPSLLVVVTKLLKKPSANKMESVTLVLATSLMELAHTSH
jgi:hypothetical protein